MKCIVLVFFYLMLSNAPIAVRPYSQNNITGPIADDGAGDEWKKEKRISGILCLFFGKQRHQSFQVQQDDRRPIQHGQ